MRVHRQVYLAVELRMCVLFLCPCPLPVTVLLAVKRIGCPSVLSIMSSFDAILNSNKHRIKAPNRVLVFFFVV